MKTEAVGNGVSLSHEGAIASNHAAGSGDIFSAMLQAIFAARTQDGSVGSEIEAVSGATEAGEEMPDWKKLAGLDELLGLAALDNRFDQLLKAETVSGVEQGVFSTGGSSAKEVEPFFSFVAQQWEDLSPQEQNIAHLLISELLGVERDGLVDEDVSAWPALLNMLAGAVGDDLDRVEELPRQEVPPQIREKETTAGGNVAQILDQPTKELMQELLERLQAITADTTDGLPAVGVDPGGQGRPPLQTESLLQELLARLEAIAPGVTDGLTAVGDDPGGQGRPPLQTESLLQELLARLEAIAPGVTDGLPAVGDDPVGEGRPPLQTESLLQELLARLESIAPGVTDGLPAVGDDPGGQGRPPLQTEALLQQLLVRLEAITPGVTDGLPAVGDDPGGQGRLPLQTEALLQELLVRLEVIAPGVTDGLPAVGDDPGGQGRPPLQTESLLQELLARLEVIAPGVTDGLFAVGDDPGGQGRPPLQTESLLQELLLRLEVISPAVTDGLPAVGDDPGGQGRPPLQTEALLQQLLVRLEAITPGVTDGLPAVGENAGGEGRPPLQTEALLQELMVRLQALTAGTTNDQPVMEDNRDGQERAPLQMPTQTTISSSSEQLMETITGDKGDRFIDVPLNNLQQQLLERVETMAAGAEKTPVLEQQLASGTVPLMAENGLSPQAVTLLAAYLQEGKPLSELSPVILQGLAEHFAGMKSPVEGEVEVSGEKNNSFASLLTRVEKFLKNLFTGGSQGEHTQLKQFGEQAGGQQLKGMPLPVDGDFQTLAGETDRTSASAVLNSRADTASLPRSFAPQLPGFQPHEVMSQVMERLAMLTRPGVQELRMQLHPEHLGNILVKLRNVKGVLSAEILTQHVAVKELLEGQLDTLRQRFQEMDLKVDEFRVFVGDEEREKGGEAGDGGKQPPLFATAGMKGKDELQDRAGLGISTWDGEQHRLDYLA